MVTNPKVSICMAAYNAEAYVGRAIESLLAQTVRDFELIIVEDGSRDATPGIIRRYACADPRIRALYNQENRGLVFTRNRALQECRAPLVAVADADDICLPARLEKQWQYLEQHPEVGIIGSAVERLDTDGHRIGTSSFCTEDRHIRLLLRLGPCLWNTTTVYRRHLLVEAGGYRQGFDRGAEDYDLWARLLKVTQFANLGESLVSVHVHGGSVTQRPQGAFANIVRVARGLLSEYLERPVSTEQAEDLVLLFYHGLGRHAQDREIMKLALSLEGKAQQVEAPDTMVLLREKISKAVWLRAQARVYSDRRLSLALAFRAAALKPGMVASAEFAKYACRWSLPNQLRLWLKSLNKPRQL